MDPLKIPHNRVLLLTLCLVFALGMSACSDPDPSEDADVDTQDSDQDADPEPDADADPDETEDAEQDATPDAEEDSETDSDEVRNGKLGREGTATITKTSYSGTEDWYFVGDEGDGPDICRIRYSLNSVGEPLDDCSFCDWAFRLVISDAELIAESDVGCSATLEIDSSNVSSLNGQNVYYGYDHDYMGHGLTLFTRTETTDWTPLVLVSYDPDTGELSYDRIDGWPEY